MVLEDGYGIAEQFYGPYCVFERVRIPHSKDPHAEALRIFRANYNTQWKLTYQTRTDEGMPKDEFMSADDKVFGSVFTDAQGVTYVQVCFSSYMTRHNLWTEESPRNDNDAPVQDDQSNDTPVQDTDI